MHKTWCIALGWDGNFEARIVCAFVCAFVCELTYSFYMNWKYQSIFKTGCFACLCLCMSRFDAQLLHMLKHRLLVDWRWLYVPSFSPFATEDYGMIFCLGPDWQVIITGCLSSLSGTRMTSDHHGISFFTIRIQIDQWQGGTLRLYCQGVEWQVIITESLSSLSGTRLTSDNHGISFFTIRDQIDKWW